MPAPSRETRQSSTQAPDQQAGRDSEQTPEAEHSGPQGEALQLQGADGGGNQAALGQVEEQQQGADGGQDVQGEGVAPANGAGGAADSEGGEGGGDPAGLGVEGGMCEEGGLPGAGEGAGEVEGGGEAQEASGPTAGGAANGQAPAINAPQFGGGGVQPGTIEVARSGGAPGKNAGEHRAAVAAQLAGLEQNGEAVKAQVGAQVTAAKTGIETDAATQRGEIQGAVAAYGAAFQAQVQAARGQVEAKFSDWMGQITAAAAQSRTNIESTKATQLARLQSEADSERGRLLTEGQVISDAARARGDQLAQRATEAGARQARSAREMAGRKIATFANEENGDKRQAMSDTVNGLANDTANQAIEAAAELAGKARESSVEVANKAASRARELHEGILVDIGGTTEQIENLAAAALARVDLVETAAVAGLEVGKTSALAQLDEVECAGLVGYEAAGSAAVGMVDQSAQQALANLDAAQADFVLYVDGTVANARSAVAGTADPDPAAFGAAIAQLSGQLTAAGASMGQIVTSAQSTFATSMAEGVASLSTDLESSNGGANGTLQATTAQLLAMLDQEGAAAVGGLLQVHTDMSEGVTQLVDGYVSGIRGAVDRALAELRSEADGGMSKIAEEVDHGIAEGDAKLNELPGKLNQAADKAAEPFEQSFWERAWGWVKGAWGAIVGLLKVLLIAALVVVVLLIAGVSWAVILAIAAVVAIVALVVVAVVSIYARFKMYAAEHGEGPGFWAGFGIVCLGILDVTGIPNMIEAGIGHHFFSDIHLTDEERGALFTHGVIALVTTLLFVKELTAIGEVTRAVEAAGAVERGAVAVERTAAASERVAGATERVAGTTERVAGATERVAGSSERVAGATEQVAGSTERAAGAAERTAAAGERAAGSWRNPRLSPGEAWALYKAEAPNGSLSWNQFQAKFARGWRYNPATQRWARPYTGGTSAAVAEAGETAAASERVAGATERVAGATERAAAAGETATSVAAKVSDTVSEAARTSEQLTAALEQVAAGEGRVSSAAQRLLNKMGEFFRNDQVNHMLHHNKVLQAIEAGERFEIGAVNRLAQGLLRQIEAFTGTARGARLATSHGHLAVEVADIMHHAVERIMATLHTLHHYEHLEHRRHGHGSHGEAEGESHGDGH